MSWMTTLQRWLDATRAADGLAPLALRLVTSPGHAAGAGFTGGGRFVSLDHWIGRFSLRAPLARA